MRDVVLAMNTTTNGRLDDPFAWFVGMTDDLYAEIDRGYGTFDTILEGGSEINRQMATKTNSYKKYVFSTTPPAEPLAWNNAEPVTVGSDDDIIRFVHTLRDQPGGDIHLSGGARLTQTLVRLGLVDEYRFFVHPVFSPGEPWFGQLDEPRHLELISATPYQNGVVGMYYRPTDTATHDDDRTGADLWQAESPAPDRS